VCLAGTHVTDAGLEYLDTLEQLRQLSLREDPVTDTGLRHLANLSRLEVLDLQGTNVSNAGLACLRGLKQLRLLGVSGTRVTPTGIKELARHLPNTHIIIGDTLSSGANILVGGKLPGPVEW
jgi:hypothetical protein